MLIPNLAVLLAQRRLTISKVSQDTGISRTTLTALTGGRAKGIQFDTLNALCQYLNVTPDALFIYRPFDLALSTPGRLGRTALTATVSRAGGPSRTYVLACDAEFVPSPPTLRVRLSLPDDPAARTAEELVPLLRALPPSVLADLERDILSRFDANLPPALAPDDYAPSLIWPWDATLFLSPS